MKNTFWEVYYQNLDNVPWQQTQADWFKELVDKRTITGDIALDVGCGTGGKSIYLAQHEFSRVVGVDISETAISLAKQNARQAEVNEQTEFYVHDVTDLSLLENQKIDFILDWATLHCIQKAQRERYIQEIVKHFYKNTLLLLRTFSSKDTSKEYFVEKVDNRESRIYLFGEKDIQNLYSPYFKVLQKHTSLPRTKPHLIFREYLMQKK